ncbi:nuclease SbcCD subunit C [Streptomyces daqingensis]|uniref:Nuclease SbcCD subunit C n=1 Tax=Streptomyces daqingensis TaxID=1472640 RepID=A0ABQ2MM54_9ACTN|nr:SMC family ATPase [Streptomyces daqingensis]GGO54263.1 nuclease SbcCD subunit C [Streptomyces daqingensis]
MRLHRLTLTAFGPFAGETAVDFDELSAAGLFLMHGATGAGKTSVLDAVCFALYGGVPGARQQPGGTLRSDYAAPDTLTEVVLDLTIGGRRLEITRRPEQSRPKRRGTGSTRERAQSWLREYDADTGEWRALSRSHQEIGEEIAQLTGMSRDQFCQVVLLPQGDFARFLRAGAEDRAKLLGRLFDTGRFAAAEEELARMRRNAQEAVRAGDEALLRLLHRMRQAVGSEAEPAGLAPAGRVLGGGGSASRTGRSARTAVPDQRGRENGGAGHAGGEPSPGDPGLAAAVLEWAALARTHARERACAASIAAGAAEERHSEAMAHLDATREVARKQRQFAEAQERARALAGQAGEREHTRERLQRARAASGVAPALALRDAAAAAHREARADEGRSRAQLPAELRDAGPDHLSRLAGEVRQELGGLDAARRAEERRTGIDSELAALERESRADEEVLREAEEWLAGWERERPVLQRRVDSAQEAAARAENLAGRLDPARQRLDAARRRDVLLDRARGAEESLLRARERAAAAQEEWLRLKDLRLRGIAAELAADLRDGSPCAVCGATEHPDPARAGSGHVDQAAEDAALGTYREAEAARQEAEQAAREVREALAAARAESKDEETTALASAVAGLEEEHAAAHAEAAGAHAAREALAQAEREASGRLAQQQDAGRRAAARTSHREALQRERAALESELTKARGGSASVAERSTLLRRRAVLLAEAAEAARREQAAADRAAEADGQLGEAAKRAGFGSPDEAAAAVLGEAEQRALQQRADEWQAAEAAVASALADPGLAAAAALPAADPGAALRATEEATQRLRAASATLEAARTRCGELDELTRQALADARGLAPLRAEYERIARLAGLAAGTSVENEHRMRLESYVLAARLEQVAAAASARLARMSAGRYTLVHSDERSGGRGRSGLGLHVVDAWTGAERDTATLSGGETFSASLALALGLADVVTDEAGGTRLQTLFIDEGFGSLDEQTLDEILDVLDSLRERDRCVGIVSHVADLRQRIPVQLEVVKSREGSALRHRTAPAAG